MERQQSGDEREGRGEQGAGGKEQTLRMKEWRRRNNRQSGNMGGGESTKKREERMMRRRDRGDFSEVREGRQHLKMG